MEIYIPAPDLKESEFSIYTKAGTTMQYARRYKIAPDVFHNFIMIPETEINNVMLFQKIVEKFGVNKQLNQLMEECAELIVAANKVIRSENTILMDDAVDHMMTEIADVENMIDQMKFIYFIASRRVESLKQSKLERLKARIT